MTNYIWITTQKEMFHFYKDAPDEVAFLRKLHRHLMKFKIYLEVKHDNRDVEFIRFKRYIEKVLFKCEDNIKNFSCEMLSDYLVGEIIQKYPKRSVKIEISEDGENGMLFDYPYEQIY